MTAAHASWPFALLEPPHDFDEAEFVEMLGELREVLSALAIASPDQHLTRSLTRDLRRWREKLTEQRSTEENAPYGQLHNADDHGLAALPHTVIDAESAGSVDATITFSRWYVGGGGTVHGGQVATVLDGLMGRANMADGWIARTAYLNVTYRAGTPIGRPVRAEIRTIRTEGRKYLLRGRLYDDATTFAEAEALFVKVARYPGAPEGS